jgi:glyoxylase-like metal-dependent hydrolase (beta-lactamase superfamily II)
VGYTGAVTRGGTPDVRELTALTIGKVSVGPMDNNAYLLTCRETGERLLVDAADDAATLLALLGDGGLQQVVTTHQHRDHWQALAEVVASTGARTLAGRADADGIPVPTAVLLDDGDRVRVGHVELEVIALAGHTPGSVALLHRDPDGHPHLWTGDSLFPGGVGNTQGDPVRFASLIDDVEHKVFDVLPDDTWFYPGHGADSTVGAERASLPEWRSRGW